MQKLALPVPGLDLLLLLKCGELLSSQPTWERENLGMDENNNNNNNTLYFKLATIIAATLIKANCKKKNKQQYYINF